MAIQQLETENLKELLTEGFVIVDFYSTTCGPCKMFSKILEDLEAEIPFLNIVKANTSEYPSLSAQYNIQAVPTVHFYKDGELQESHVGLMQAAKLKEIVANYLYS